MCVAGRPLLMDTYHTESELRLATSGCGDDMHQHQRLIGDAFIFILTSAPTDSPLRRPHGRVRQAYHAVSGTNTSAAAFHQIIFHFPHRDLACGNKLVQWPWPESERFVLASARAAHAASVAATAPHHDGGFG